MAHRFLVRGLHGLVCETKLWGKKWGKVPHRSQPIST